MENVSKIPLIVITGPTATGKTALSIALCKAFGGEVVGADSMQIYKGMTIGTAAPTQEEMQGVPHHLIGFLSPNMNFSVADYVLKAKEVIKEINSRGKLPFLVGGTGLYIRSLLQGIKFEENSDRELREEIQKRFEANPEKTYEELQKIDFEAAEKIHKNDEKRVVRALEIFYKTGITKTEFDKKSKRDSEFSAKIIALSYKNRSTLYDKIDLRVDNIINAGLEDEIGRLLCEGVDRESTAMQAIGYKEILNEPDRKTGIEKIKQASRRYAKRQLTFLRTESDVNWLFVDELSPSELLEEARKIIER